MSASSRTASSRRTTAGAIYAEGIVSAVRCTFDTNQAERGGAVLSFGPRASFSECVFSGNSASTPEGTGRGGAAFCFSLIPGEQEVSFSRCIFLGNHAELQGGALHISGCLGSVTYCVFGGNYVADGVPSSMGGALNIYYELPHPPPPPSPPDPLLVDHCTFSANAGDHGGSISCGGDLAPDVSRSIIAFGEGSEGIYCDGVSPFVTQCCVYGNAGGDSLCGVEANNLFLDPAFCDAGALDFTVRGDSPCLAENNPWGELLGALGQGCPAAAGIDESGGGAELSLRARGFNPFADAGTVAYAVPYEGAPLRVSVYSLTGRLVRVLHDGPSPSTAGTLRWNGRNAAGELVGSGVYFCRAVCGSETAAAKLVLVR